MRRSTLARQRTNRRSFLRTASAMTVGFWVAGSTRPARSEALNEQIQIACIGVGGKGKSDSLDAALEGKVVAICDVDDQAREQLAAGEAFQHARQFYDFREMLTEMENEIDAVTVSTPDHTHAVAATMAMSMGKHCFCQKPLTHSIYEARVLGELARAQGVKTQMGNQGTDETGVRRAAGFLQAGGLGRVSEVHVWTNRPVWPQGMERPTEEPPVPAHLHWDQWIGPAPYRPYHPAYHPFKWRGFWDFGTGALGDMACHTLNMPFMGLNLRDPSVVTAQSSGHNQETFPSWSRIKFEFPKLDDRDALELTWYDGGELPDDKLFDQELMDWLLAQQTKESETIDPKELMRSGVLIVGEKGKLFSPDDYGAQFTVTGIDVDALDIDFEESPGHFVEWIEAIDGGPEAVSNFPNYAGPLTETVLLGNLAVWAGKRVEWDASTMDPVNAPELSALVNREYRDGWALFTPEAASV